MEVRRPLCVTPTQKTDAQNVAKIAHDVAERGTSDASRVGETTLRDLLKALSEEVVRGVVEAKPKGADIEPVRLVLGKGQPVARVVEDFVRRLKPLVLQSEVLEVELSEPASQEVHVVGGTTKEEEQFGA